MSLVSDLDFVLFDLGMVTCRVSLGFLFLSLPRLGLSVFFQFRGGEMVVSLDWAESLKMC